MLIQRVITVVNLGLITLGAYFGTGLFYQIVSLKIQPTATFQEAPVAASSEKTPGVRPISDYSVILKRDLFKTRKEATTPETAKNVDLENLEQTTLKLKLWGTVSGDPDKAYAVIEDTQKREQNLYRVGDSIQAATLKAILREKVVLSVNGKDEILAMEDIKQDAGRSNSGARPAGAARPLARTGEGAVRTQRVSLRRNMINEAMGDVSKLMTEIAIVPHMEDGQPAGLAMSKIKPNSIFRRMGLRNGDILKGVDGQEIRSVDDALKLYENLKEASSVNVQILRRGQQYNIDYNIR
jgi:general secretion pathway protein C